jgi:hypothetical protein
MKALGKKLQLGKFGVFVVGLPVVGDFCNRIFRNYDQNGFLLVTVLYSRRQIYRSRQDDQIPLNSLKCR